jgi:hypothetical protein
MPHYLTNRGKLILLQGGWDDAAATAIKLGLLNGSAVPAAIDTEAEIQALNTVAELLALTGVDEPTQAWYTSTGSNGRVDLTRTNAAEDDTNNRVNLDAADVTYTGATAGGGETHVCGGFWYDATTDTNDTTRLLMGVFTFATPIALNGSDITFTIADLVRAS